MSSVPTFDSTGTTFDDTGITFDEVGSTSAPTPIYDRLSWSVKSSPEVVLRYVDFVGVLTPGDVLVSATCAAYVWSGNDPAPAIVSSTVVQANGYGSVTLVAVTLTGGVIGTIYSCVVTAQTQAGETLVKAAVIAII
jgi:hypothetical protein